MASPGFDFGIGDFIKLLELAESFRERFVNAPRESKATTEEVEAFGNALKNVEKCLSEHQVEKSDEAALLPILRNCHASLLNLGNVLDQNQSLLSPIQGSQSWAQNIWKRLNFDRDKLAKLRADRSSNALLLNMVQGSLTSKVTLNIEKLLKQIHNNQLTPPDFTSQHTDFLRRREPGTGDWVLESDEFVEWVSKKNRTLLCTGDPGAGKTTVTAMVIEHLFTRIRDSRINVGIGFIFFSFKQAVEQTRENIFESLLKQLLQSQPLPDSVAKLYESAKINRRGLLLDEISQGLRTVIKHYSYIVIILDALDECEASCREDILSMIMDLRAIIDVNIFVTSRLNPEVTDFFQMEHVLPLKIYAKKEDLNKYLDRRVRQLIPFRRLRNTYRCGGPNTAEQQEASRLTALSKDIKNNIIIVAKEMFLLAELSMNYLDGVRTIEGIQTALENLPQGSEAYDSMYQATMKRIESQSRHDKELALRVLLWISSAKRPLTPLELQHALATKVNTLRTTALPEIQDIISFITRSRNFFRDNYFTQVEPDVGMVCITYLSFPQFESGACRSDQEFVERLTDFPFYEYAAKYWGYHAQSSPLLADATMHFLQNTAKVQAASQAMWAYKGIYQYYSQRRLASVHGQHLAAHFGIEKAIDIFTQTEIVACPIDGNGRTPLSWAAEHGSEEIVKLLLQRGLAPDERDNRGRTPLSYAAAEGHVTVANLLVSYCADANVVDKRLSTPLIWAVENGHMTVIEVLIDVGNANVNFCHPSSRPPLHWAILEGHGHVVDALYKRGANIHWGDRKGNTLLFDASWADRDSIFKSLMKKGCDAHIRNNKGRTILSHVAAVGKLSLLQFLLDNEKIDPDIRCDQGRTPLSFAAEVGEEQAVKLLLAHPRVDLDARDNDGWTPLMWAAEKGREGVVKILLRAEGVNPAPKNKWNETPLSRAAMNGQNSIMRLLLSQDCTLLNSSDIDGRTPLIEAVRGLKKSAVQFLLSEPSLKLNHCDSNGRTALTWAASLGNEDIVRMLLAKAGVMLDFKDNSGATPLSWAAKKGHLAVVRLLLGAGGDPNCADSYNNTPLNVASKGGYSDIVKVLLDTGTQLEKSTSTRAAVHDAAFLAHKEVERLLLERVSDGEIYTFRLESLFMLDSS